MLSKTTVNYAIRRELDVTNTIAESPTGSFAMNVIWIWELLNIDEPLVIYIANDDGSFSFQTGVCMDYNLTMELPAHIRDEKHLRQVLDFISKNLA